MSLPIPISSTPPHSHVAYGTMTTPSSSSTLSISPQTPFFPPPGLATSPSLQAQQGMFKWASSFGKSPPNAHANANGTSSTAPMAMPMPEVFRPEDHEHDEHERHDSFEFGDMNDLRSRSWNRRAVSVTGPSGISSLLKGFGATSPSVPAPTMGTTPAGEAVPCSAPAPGQGVMADKVAKGQGVLRRLSMSGVGFVRPTFLSPPSTAAPLPAPLPAADTTPVMAGPVEPPTADPVLQRANTVSGVRGRRYSEASKKRGVSPMGERILREHGHF